ncbi:hypothetical protein ACFYO0_05825 [Streptomyces sp. NPDC006365]
MSRKRNRHSKTKKAKQEVMQTGEVGRGMKLRLYLTREEQQEPVKVVT